MKTKIIVTIFMLMLQVSWGQKLTKDQKQAEKVKAETLKEEADKTSALKAIAAYKKELIAVNKHIEELQELIKDETLSKKSADQLMATLNDLITKRQELKSKISELELKPSKVNAEENGFNNKIDIKEARYTFLNGVNFDFTESKTNYVGHFNVYVPYYKKDDYENKLGVNAGILKVNYLTRDSIVNYATENVLINPLDTPNSDGETYNRQYNRYTTSTKVTTMSFYAQPLYRICEVGAANFYVHLHFELLYSKFETGTRLKTIQTQEITIDADNPAPAPETLVALTERETRTTVNLESPHFGIGSTIDLNFKDDCILFFQPTIGIALNTIDRHLYKDADGNYTLRTFDKPQAFLLIRSYFQYNTSKATQIILGTDIRGLMPNQPPYLSAYVGLNLGIDQIFK